MPKSTVVQDVVLPELTGKLDFVERNRAMLLADDADDVQDLAFAVVERETQLLSALTQLAELTPEIEELKGSRVHTQEWYASHYAKLHDWARKVLPYPYRNQYFSCVANGTYDVTLDRGESYMCKAGFMVIPSGYIPMDDAKGQIIREQTTRAEDAESRAEAAERKLAELRAASELLARAADLLDEVPVVHDANFWHDYYLYSGNHMICTDEGWDPGEAKQSYLDQWVEDGGSNPILCEVNAPQPSPASAVKGESL